MYVYVTVTLQTPLVVFVNVGLQNIDKLQYRSRYCHITKLIIVNITLRSILSIQATTIICTEQTLLK